MLVPIFNGNNYDFWSIKMRTFFLSQDLWDIIVEDFVVPKNTSTLSVAEVAKLKINKQKDACALFILQHALADSIFLGIIRAKTTKQAWDILQEEFQDSIKIRTMKLLTLRRELKFLK